MRQESPGHSPPLLSSSTKRTRWKDLPSRLLTISVCFPILVWILHKHVMTRLMFFIVIHFLMGWEWMTLLPHQHQLSLIHDKESFPSSNSSRKRHRQQEIIFPLISIVLSLTFHSHYLLVFLVISACILYLGISIISSFPSKVTNMSHNKNHNNKMDEKVEDPYPKNDLWNVTLLLHIFMGFLFITIPMFYWIQLSSLQPPSRISHTTVTTHTNIPYNQMAFQHILYLLCIVWNCDSGALVLGRFMGSSHDTTTHSSSYISLFTSMISIISPSKTLSGIVGGIVSSILTAIYFPRLYPWISSKLLEQQGQVDQYHYDYPIFYPQVHHPFFLGFVLGVCSILGDFVESTVKRNAKRKDSGSLLPGHGGILDRFDSSLLSVVVYYVFFLNTDNPP